MSKETPDSIWTKLRRSTQARIGLNRSGHAISTRDLLDFQLAHARARDAVLDRWDVDAVARELQTLGLKTQQLESQTFNRAEYLQRPDLGRALSAASVGILETLATAQAFEVVFVATDGLSSKATTSHLAKFLNVLMPRLDKLNFNVAPVLLVPFARVGISDAIGEALKAKLVVILVGERPGLSSTDSLGLYLTYEATRGRSDADRNCISNVRPPMGLGYEQAADKLVYLMNESLRLKLSGVNLKEDANPTLADVTPPTSFEKPQK